MKIDILEKGDYGFDLKGSRVLKLLMDQETPPIDLLVRESIQNSCDATLPSKKCSRIYFDLGEFNCINLSNQLENIGESLKEKYGNSKQPFLAIRDKNTCGLLGKADDDRGPNNNLYGLVYSFLESNNKEDYSGGSWGIGKSVYYRFGIGLVFYYSRVYENNKYIHKLCGAVIENEESNDTLIKNHSNSTGVAFLGNVAPGRRGGTTRSIPITNEENIEKFLNIFSIPMYKGEETGTTIIIPFFNKNECSSKFKNEEYKPWENDFINCLKISIQRWYFPKIFNEDFNAISKGKFTKIFINKNNLELNDFFLELQKLYSDKCEGAESKEIISTQNFTEKLGTFKFKKFNKKDLNINIPPENLPNPYVMLDIKNNNDIDNDKNDAIIFYTRRPGMIVTYDDSNSFTSLKTEKDEFIIGIFVLNDSSKYKNNELGKYFKECEAANHKKWIDIYSSKKEDVQQIIGLRTKPFRKIKSEIQKTLQSKFNNSFNDEILTTNTALQRILGNMLLPPEDFGKNKEPSIKRRKKNEVLPDLKKLKQEKRTNLESLPYENGYQPYLFQVYLKPGEQFICKLLVNTATSKYSFEDWDNLDFTLPCTLEKIKINQYFINKMSYNLSSFLKCDNSTDNSSILKKDGRQNDIFQLSVEKTKNTKTAASFKLLNLYNEDIRMNFTIYLKPKDITSSFSFLQNISKYGGVNNG